MAGTSLIGKAVATKANDLMKKKKEEEAQIQKSVSTPAKQTNNSQSTHTLKEALARVYEISKSDPKRGKELQGQLMTQMGNPSSMYYQKYMNPTNQAVGNLRSYGIDTSMLTREWFDNNHDWESNLIYSGTTNTPSKPGKKATEAQILAYDLFQYNKAMPDTTAAKTEWSNMQREIAYWANRTDLNMSDDAIVNKVKKDMKQKYPTLYKMYNSSIAAGDILELNEGFDFSEDAMYGTIWKSRNMDYTGNMYGAIANSGLGNGNVWQYDAEKAAKLDPNSPEFHPYSVGMTGLDEAGLYFGMLYFPKQWVEEHEGLAYSEDETEKKMFNLVREGYNNQTSGEKEYDALMDFINTKAQYIKDPEQILEKINWSKYPTLAKMDNSIGKKETGKDPVLATGQLVPMTEGLRYRYADLQKYVYALCEYNNSRTDSADYYSGLAGSFISAGLIINGGNHAEDKTITHPGYRPTEEQVQVAKSYDKTLKEDAELTHDVSTPAEKTANRTQLATMYDSIKDVLGQFKTQVVTAVTDLYQNTVKSNIGSYSKSILGNFDTVADYERNDQVITELEAKEAELREKIGAQEVAKVNAGNAEFDEEAFARTGRLEDQPSWDLLSEESKEKLLQLEQIYSPDDLANYYNIYLQKDAQAPAQLTEEQQAEVAEYKKTVDNLELARERKASGEEAYNQAKKDIEIKQQAQDDTIAMMKEAGLDTTEMENAAIVTDFFLNFTKYDPTSWASYNFYHPISNMLISGGDADEALKEAATGDEAILEAIDVAKTLLDYADEKGMQMPDSVKENVMRYIESLERQHQDYQNLTLLKEEDFATEAQNGRTIADAPEKHYFDWSAWKDNPSLEAQPGWNMLSKDQQDELIKMNTPDPENGYYGSDINDIATVFDGLMDRMDVGSRMFGTYFLKDLMTDYEMDTYYYLLAKQGRDAAEEYVNHLTDGSYGVMNSRAAEKTGEKAEELAEKGFWGRRAASTLSILLAPVAAAGSFIYDAEVGLAKLRGERVEFNPQNINLSANIFKKSARAKINEEIIKTYGKDTALQQFMSGLEEIISTRGDSLMNSLVYGGLFKSIGSNIVREFMSALPMATMAATDAVAEAKENGVADDMNLLGIFASTLFAESFTEAISLDNMRKAFKAGGDITTDGLKSFFKDWLTNSGISEMIGETATEVWEQYWDKRLAGDNSEYEQLVRKYQEEDSTLSEKDARLMAGKEMMNRVLHTALISYLTPGLDIVSYSAGRYMAYRSEAKYRQQNDNNVSVLDVYREYKQIRQARLDQEQNGWMREEEKPIVPVKQASEEEASVAVPENNAEQTAITPEQQAAQQQTLDFEILETAKEADVASQTASIAAVLDVENTTESSNVANAAAANMTDLFGETVTPAEGTQDLIVGGYAGGVDSASVKQAIRTAALSKDSAAYQMMHTEEYRNGDPAERAQLLATTVEIDADNPTVQEQISQATHENRVARAEKDAVNTPEVKAKHDAAYAVQGKLLAAQQGVEVAKKDYDLRNAAVDAARKNLQTASAQYQNGPIDKNAQALINEGIQKLMSATEVAQEYKQRLENAQAKEEAIQKELDKAVEEVATTKREVAEQMVAEQDQKEAALKAETEAKAQAVAVEQAKQQAQAEATDSVNVSDMESFIDMVRKNNPNITDDQIEYIRKRFAQKQAARTPVLDENGNVTDVARKVAARINEKFNVPIVFVKDITKGNTEIYKEGYYDPNNHRIIIDGNMSIEDALTRVLPHELLHSLEKSDSYNKVVNSLLSIIYGEGSDIEKAISNLENNGGKATNKLEQDIKYIKEYYESKTGEKHDFRYAAQEIAAKRMGEMFYNPNNPTRSENMINQLVKENPSAAKQIMNSIKTMLKKVVGMKGAWKSNAEKTVDLFETALRKSSGTDVKQIAKKPAYKIQKSRYSDNLTVRFDQAPSEAVNAALRNIGMVPYKDSKGNWGWRSAKGMAVPEARIQYAIKQAMKQDNRMSLPDNGLDSEIDRYFDEYIENLSAEELDQLSQELFGIPLSSPAEGNTNNATEEAQTTDATEFIGDLRDAYKDAVESGDMATARKIIGKVAQSAGYTIYGTHRTNGKFNVFEKSKRSGERGATLGDGFYIAKGEHTEYDNDHYGKNRMLVHVNPGNVFDIQKSGLPREQAEQVFDEYFAPYHPPMASEEDSPYRIHVINQLQNSLKVMDYIKEAANNAETTTDEIFKALGYNSIKDGPQYAVFDSNQIKLADPVTYDDDGNAIPISERFNSQKADIRYSLPEQDNTIAEDDDGNPIATALPGGTVMVDTGIKYSLSSFNEDEQARVRAALLARKDENGNQEFTEEEVDKYMDDALSIAAMIAADRTRLDFEASDNQVFLKPNNDYYFTLDASTLCAKRLLYQGTFDYVQHALPDEVFTPEDLIDLANIMNEMGYETPCGICYVESRRRWLDTYAQKFLDELPTDANGFIDKYFKKATEEVKAEIRESYTGEKPSIDDLTTSDGLEKLRHSDPHMYKAFVDAMNKKGTANPKVVQLRTEYRGDIGKLTKNDIQKVKDIGGLRIQSFSDFETPHLLDMIQAVMDMASVGLTSQAYTKVPNFAWVFGDTGIKINLSLIGKGTGLDANGNLVFDNREGIDFDEAMKLRERYNHNVGTILVGINDEHIIAAMGDPRIDFIIPFHKSGWSAEELRKMPTLNYYDDYTDSQNELMIVGDRKHRVKEVKNLGVKALDNWIIREGNDHPGYKVIDQGDGKYTVTYDIGYETESFKTHKERTGEKLSNFEPVGAHQYWEFDKSGEWNARKYLKMCAESGRIPKFSQFLVDNGDGSFSLPEGTDKRSTAIREGYWKTLIDFKMYENDGYGRTKEDGSKTEVRGAEQREVTPDINMNEAYRVMNEYELGRQMPDKENGQKGAFIQMKSNNDVPVAVPAGERYIELIRQKREGKKPVNPDDTLHATPVISATSGESFFGRGPSQEANMNAATTFGATQAPAVLGNTESTQQENASAQQNAMAIDAETGETVHRRLSLPSDAPYLSAVDHGDMETAQKMVDEKAKENGYDIEYAVWRGDSKPYNVLEQSGEGGNLGNGLYFTPSEQYARRFASKDTPVRKFYLKKGNTFDYDAFTQEFNDYAMDWLGEEGEDRLQYIDQETWSQLWDDFISENGYDSVDATGVGGLSYGAKETAVQNSWQAKLADPVTYDDEGNVIPLSERFNDQNDDIRYSLPSDDILDQQIDEFLGNGGILSQQQKTPKAAPDNPAMGYRQWGNEMAQESDELAEQAKQAVLNSEYAKDTNAAELARAIDWVRSNRLYAGDDGYQESLQKVMSKRFNYRTKDGQARIIAVMALAAYHNDVNAQVQLADAYNGQGTDIAQALQARKLLRLMTPQGRIASLRKMLGNIQDQLESKGIQKELKLSDWIYQAAAEATEEGEFAKIREAAAIELAQQLPANWKDKLRSLRMLSMLGNPRTHIRNIVGNALFVPAVGLKNKLGAIAEMATGQNERTKTLALTLSKDVKAFARQDAEFMKDELTGESKYNEGNIVQRQQKPFKGFLQALMDFNSKKLEDEDWFFLKGHYRRALGGWIQANGYTVEQLKSNPELLEKGREYAINEAQKATYRDFNGLADRLNKLSRNPETTGQKILGFATDAVLPFKKTPANILKRGIEYSPAGLVRGLKNMMVDVRNGKMTATQAIDRICSGLAGSAVLALGAFLSHAGVVTVGMDDDEDKLEKEQGNQKYSVRIKMFGQDVTFTLDWAAPMSMPFFVGAALEQELRKEGDFDINAVVNAMGNIAEPVLNLSMLDGVNTLFKTSQNDDTDTITQIGAKVLSNYVTSYVPSMLGAIARTIDSTRRVNYVKSGEGKGITGTFNYAREQVENKIPGLSQTNIPMRDVFGNPETSGLVERVLENWILPGYISNYKNDPVLNEMDRLYRTSVADSEDMIPKDPAKTVKYKGDQYKLTAEEWDTYKTERGQTAYKVLTGVINSSDYKNADAEAQVQMIKEGWQYADQVGKKAVIPNFDMNNYGSDPVKTIIREGKITSYSTKMMQALAVGDYVAYQTMVQALRDEGVEDSTIKTKIANKYRDMYKDAYKRGDTSEMADIQDILDMTDFEFDTDAWEEQVDKKKGNP